MKQLTTVFILILILSSNVFGVEQENELQDKKAKKLKIFDWTLTFDKEDAIPEGELTESKLDKYIRTTKNQIIVKERERVLREKERVDKREAKRIEKAKRSEKYQIESAKKNAEERIGAAKREALEAHSELDEGLRIIAKQYIDLEIVDEQANYEKRD